MSHSAEFDAGPYVVGEILRYAGTDPRYVGQEGRVLRADYDTYPYCPLVVELPGGPKGIGICLRDEDVERVTPPEVTP